MCEAFDWLFGTFLTVLSTLIIITAVTPLFLVVIIPLIIAYAVTQRYYISSSRELKRLESISKAGAEAPYPASAL